jgi:hypothetical protein
MNRREVLAGIGASTLVPARAWAGQAQEVWERSPLARAAYNAHLYTLPLIESATARAGWARAGGQIGKFLHMRAPTTPATQRITTPNNDTLNSRAWLDLGQGPVRLRWPATGSRYISVAMMDMYSNNFAVLGSRTTGPDGGAFTIVGPNDAAPPGAIRSPTRWMWILVRLLVDGESDLAKAHAIQDAIGLEAPAPGDALPTYAGRAAPWPDYFESAARLMRENPGPATDTAMVRLFAPLDFGRFDAKRFTAAEGQEIAAGLESAKAELSTHPTSGTATAGWIYPRADLGDFGQDYFYRAQIAINGFAALPVAEAVYLFAAGPRGDLKLDSGVSWRLRLAREQLPPNDAFWSLTMYRATPEGQLFLFDNPIQRYSIGDRTPGLRHGNGGEIEIVMQRDAPTRADTANWLPTPHDAPFGLVFRVYRPRPAVLDGLWRLPAIEQVDQI